LKVFVVVLILVLFVAAPVGRLCAEPFCDWALESGKFLDWLVCQVFAMILGDYRGDNFGNGVLWD
jgi:hypothetical protein